MKNTFYLKRGKRLLDFTISFILLILLLPVMLVIALLVRFFMGRGILFKQERPGYHGRLFTVYKFRTMREVYDRAGRPLPDLLRLPMFGKILRKFNLDELPQLWNVLTGKMSLIGPKPLTIENLSVYDARLATRQDVKPGILGWAQIHRGYEVTWDDKIGLDVWYVKHYSAALDGKVLLYTFLALFKVRSLAAESHQHPSETEIRNE